MARRGILSFGAYLPYRRLDRGAIAPVTGKGGGKGTRTVASYDQDTTAMGVEAARVALSATEGLPDPAALWFATGHPAYADKTNATAIHAALGLDPSAQAFDVSGPARSSLGALEAALGGAAPALVLGSDMVTGLPGSADEAAGGDAAAAVLIGSDTDGDLLAEQIGSATVTEEFLDRWRDPGDQHGQTWEERFGEGRYLDAGVRAWDAALASAGLRSDQVDLAVVIGPHVRAGVGLGRKLGLEGQLAAATLAAALPGQVGFTGTAHPLLALGALLEDAEPEKILGVICLGDGADVGLWRTADALAASCPAWPMGSQLSAGGPVPYGTYLAWRGYLPVDPPRRPTPSRPSAPAATRSREWKFGFVGSTGPDGTIHLPPSALDREAVPMADATGTVVTFTIDKLAYSPSPPVVFAVVDFDGGGRLPVELTDVDADEVQIGDRVEMTFRKLFTADGIHNYFWKARPIRRPVESAIEGGEG